MKKTLANSIIDVLDDMDIRHISTEEQRGELITELEWYSDAGEDIIIDLWHKGNKKSFADAFAEYAEDFDPDEHAEMWIEFRGKGGCPSSIRELLDDADGIKKHLEDTAEALRKVA